MMGLRHLPERAYIECNSHIHPEDFQFYQGPKTDKELEDYEAWYDEIHFYTDQEYDYFLTCEDNFVGLCCFDESHENYNVPWPCSEAAIEDYIIVDALQNDQKLQTQYPEASGGLA